MEPANAALSEAARRLLKTEQCTLEVPLKLAQSAAELAMFISDNLPSLIREPKVVSNESWSYICISTGSGLLSRIGGPEPEISASWLTCNHDAIETNWDLFSTLVRDLVIAGYPGCVDCAGPAASEVWDEVSSRAKLAGSGKSD